jgi:hypothetical protein
MTPQEIWDDLNKTGFEMFGIPNQSISKYSTPIFVGSRLRIKPIISSLLPFLEMAFSSKYDFELAEAYILISEKGSK